jgi:hypothetical protein
MNERRYGIAVAVIHGMLYAGELDISLFCLIILQLEELTEAH